MTGFFGLSRLTRRSFVKGACIMLLGFVGLLVVSMLPSIGDRTGYAAFYMMFALFWGPPIVLGVASVFAPGRWKDIGLSPALALVPIADAGRVIGEVGMVPHPYLTAAFFLPLFLFGSGALKSPRPASIALPMFVFVASYAAATAAIVVYWLNPYFAMPMTFVNEGTSIALAISSVWLAIAARRGAMIESPARSDDVLSKFFENAFAGTPWAIIAALSLLAAVGMRVASGAATEHFLLTVPKSFTTAFLVGLVLAPLHQLLIGRRISAIAFLIFGALPFVHWGMMKAASAPQSEAVVVMGALPANADVEALVMESSYSMGNFIPDLMNELDVDHLVMLQKDGGYRSRYRSAALSTEQLPILSFEEALNGDAAIVIADWHDAGMHRLEIHHLGRDGEKVLLTSREWTARRGVPLVALPVLGRMGWAYDIMGRDNVNNYDEAASDVVDMLARAGAQ